MESDVAFPAARKSTNSITGDTVSFDKVTIPEGKHVGKVLVDLAATVAGTAGTGTSMTAAAIKEIEIKNEDGVRVLFAQGGGGIGILAYLCAALMAIVGLVPRRVINDDVMAGSSTYYGNWEIAHGLVGKEFTASVTFNALSVLAGYTTSPTSATLSVLVSYELTDEAPVPARLSGLVRASQTEYAADVIAALVGIDGTSIATNFEGLQYGKQTFNAAQIAMLENMTNLKLRGAGADGTQAIPGVTAPDTATLLYAALFAAEDVETISITCLSSTLLIGKIEPYSE